MAIVMVVVVVHVATSLDLGRTGYTSKQPLRRYPKEASVVEGGAIEMVHSNDIGCVMLCYRE